MTKKIFIAVVGVSAVISVITSVVFDRTIVDEANERLAAGLELVVIRATKGIRYNDVVTEQYASITVAEATSTASLLNSTGKTMYVDPSDVMVEMVNPITGQATTSSSTVFVIFATSTTPHINDYANPRIEDTLIGSSTMATTGAARGWTKTPANIVFSGGGMPRDNYDQKYVYGLASTTSKHASSTVAVPDGGYFVLILRPYSSLCGGKSGSPNVDNLVATSCESASSSPAKPRATFKYRQF